MALVRSGISDAPMSPELLPRFAVLPDSDWQALLSMARRQTVTGLLVVALEHLPEDIPVPPAVEFALMAEADRLELNYFRMSEAVRELEADFHSKGITPVWLKGLECARFYPRPELRELGDIDLWLRPRDFSTAGFVSSAPDGSYHFQFQGFDVDVHRDYYDISHHEGLPKIPSPEAELLMLNVHILKHACSTGIGLRQLCDMVQAYSRLPYDEEKYKAACCNAGILRWTVLLSSFLGKYFGDGSAPLFGQASVNPAPLERIIRRGGNFGHHESGRQAALSRKPLLRKADTFWRMLRSLPFALRYAPAEALYYGLSLIRGNIKTNK